MLGKPMQINEARDLHQNGLKIVSCYQYGKSPPPIGWAGKARACSTPSGLAAAHSRRRSANVPIYASIDDDPSFGQYQAQVAPYLRGWESVVGHQRTGVYGNSKTIEWALHDSLGSYFWQHNWGSPGGRTHPCRPSASGRDRQAPRRRVGVDINTSASRIRPVGLS